MSDASTLHKEPSTPLRAHENRPRWRRALTGIPLATLGLALALVAQTYLVDQMFPWDGAIVFALALVLWLRALDLAQAILEAPPAWSPQAVETADRLASPVYLLVSTGFAALAWLLLGDQSFTLGGVVAWIASLGFLLRAVFQPPRLNSNQLVAALSRLWYEGIHLRLSALALLVVAALLLAAFFRFYHLPTVPAEVTSDHVEKLLDVRDVLHGNAPLFFPRNTGRELLQFYLAAPVAAVVGLSHLTLQLVTIAASLAAVLATFFLGRELLSPRIGLLAALLMAVSRWDVTLARTGLRFSLTTLFTALTLLFLFRALRTQKPSQYVLCGLCLGLGLLGYSNFRVVPLLVLGLIALSLVLPGGCGLAPWRSVLRGSALTFGSALLVALPLLKYGAAYPDMVWQRGLSRIGPVETLPGDAWVVLVRNLGDALLMFNWRGDVGWVHNVGLAAALDVVTGSFFILGLGYVVYRLVRGREFWTAALLLSIPALLLPSAMSVAFPMENPSFNRASGAIPVVFLVAATTPALLLQVVRGVLPVSAARLAAATAVGALLLWSAVENGSLYFGDFAQNYRASVPNSSEIARIALGHAQGIGGRDAVFIVSYPHWVDHRAVGMHMGDLTWNNVLLDPEQIAQTAERGAPSIYLVHPMDEQGLAEVRRHHPRAPVLHHESAVSGKDFLLILAY